MTLRESFSQFIMARRQPRLHRTYVFRPANLKLPRDSIAFMQLGFVTAILPDLSLEDVLQFAAQNHFDCVEVMCWPKGKAARRYAGVTHIDVTGFTKDDAARTNELTAAAKVRISGLGYYPNPLVPDTADPVSIRTT